MGCCDASSQSPGVKEYSEASSQSPGVKGLCDASCQTTDQIPYGRPDGSSWLDHKGVRGHIDRGIRAEQLGDKLSLEVVHGRNQTALMHALTCTLLSNMRSDCPLSPLAVRNHLNLSLSLSCTSLSFSLLLHLSLSPLSRSRSLSIALPLSPDLCLSLLQNNCWSSCTSCRPSPT
jgi:hypothetical protein